jgi:8-oxo-dGTP diphosphatase
MEYEKPSLSADNVIFRLDENNLYLLLIKRKNPPFKDAWALPGGFVDKGETAHKAALRELEEETGIKLNKKLFHIDIFSKPGRDPRGWIVSSAYMFVTCDNVKIKAGDDADIAKWFDINSLPDLAFDHSDIINSAINTLYKQICYVENLISTFDRNMSISDIENIRNILL